MCFIVIIKRKQIDYLIIGAGLAGTTLAWKLHEMGIGFKLIDAPKLSTASLVAGGFMNPITGKWMTKSKAFEGLLSEAIPFYKSIEHALKISILKPLPIRRYFLNPEDSLRAIRKIKNPRFNPYLNQLLAKGEDSNGITDDFGSVLINEGYWLDVPKYLGSLRTYFMRKDLYIEDEVNCEIFAKKEIGTWHYKGLHAKNLIFCQGIHILNNPFFINLPISPIKGDVLTLKIPDLELPNGLYYKKRWLHSIEPSLYRFGASYETGISDLGTKLETRNDLIKSLQIMTRLPFEILRHQTGIRPTTVNTKPIIIQHPIYKSLYAINGLSSKGTLSAPSLAKDFIHYFHNKL